MPYSDSDASLDRSRSAGGVIKRSKRWLAAIVAVSVIPTVIACSSSSTGASTVTAIPPSVAAATAIPTLATPASTSAAPPVENSVLALQAATENIYEKVNPSVVNVRVVQKQEVGLGSQLLPNPFFGLPAPQGPQDQFQTSEGSGFIWDNQGHIVTNNHVVAGADRISVTYSDGSIVGAKVVGTDPDSDLAVIKVDDPFPEVEPLILANSDDVKVGQFAVAIGNPFGLQGTLTTGVVSAVGRSLPGGATDSASGGTYSIPDVVQTDAPINPGNSGGVLLDIDGRLVGVTSAIISPVRASAGIGFAIPSWIVQKVVPTLIDSGEYQHPFLGMSLVALNPDVADAMGLEPDQRGAVIVDIIPDGPADRAGFRGSDRQVTIDGQDRRVGGDLIVEVDGQPVNEPDDLILYLFRQTLVGQSISITYLRDGTERTTEVVLAARPSPGDTADNADSAQAGRASLGIQGLSVDQAVAEAMGLDPDQRGVLIEQVTAGSGADEAGLRGSFKPATAGGRQILIGGDVITGWNGEQVDDFDQLRSLVGQAKPGNTVTLQLLRDGSSIEVDVTLGER